ncbi:MAG: hypothetical protein WKG00_29515, partial [Polyangiaceae bacterium]
MQNVTRSQTNPHDLDIVCVSHLRWDFVFQRPQHLLTRASRGGRVLYVEEPVWREGEPVIELRMSPEGVQVAVPHLPPGQPELVVKSTMRRLLHELVARLGPTGAVTPIPA